MPMMMMMIMMMMMMMISETGSPALAKVRDIVLGQHGCNFDDLARLDGDTAYNILYTTYLDIFGYWIMINLDR